MELSLLLEQVSVSPCTELIPWGAPLPPYPGPEYPEFLELPLLIVHLTGSPGPELTLSLDLSSLSSVFCIVSLEFTLNLWGSLSWVCISLYLLTQTFQSSCKLPLLLEYLTVSPGPELLI